jgi:hypothetical protein
MPYDANLALVALTTTTTHVTATGVNLVAGTPRRGLKARIIITAVTGTSPTFLPKIQESADNTTYTDLAYPIGTDTLTAAGEYFFAFDTSQPYVRLFGTIGGTAPSVAFSADIGIARP